MKIKPSAELLVRHNKRGRSLRICVTTKRAQDRFSELSPYVDSDYWNTCFLKPHPIPFESEVVLLSAYDPEEVSKWLVDGFEWAKIGGAK